MKSYLKTIEPSDFFELVDKKSDALQALLVKYKSPRLIILNDTNFQTKIICHFKNCSEVADTVIQKELREESENRKKRLKDLAFDVIFEITFQKNQASC